MTSSGLDGPGIESGWDGIFRTRPDQPWPPPHPPVQRVPGHNRQYNGRGVALSTHPHLALCASKISHTVTFTLLWYLGFHFPTQTSNRILPSFSNSDFLSCLLPGYKRDISLKLTLTLLLTPYPSVRPVKLSYC